MKEIFDTYSENAFDHSTAAQVLECKRQWIAYNYTPFLPSDRTAPILDIGPGMGEFLLTLKEMGYTQAKAVDISPSVTEYCRSLGLVCECVEDTTTWLQAHQGEFALITLLDVIEHLPKEALIAFLSACKQALAPNGQILIQVPNLQAPEGYLHRYNDITHEIGFVEHTLRQVLQVSGFTNFQCYPFEEYPETDEESLRKKQIRAFYWTAVTANRTITHNLQPQILTPELIIVANTAPTVTQFPESAIQQRNPQLSIDDMVFFCERFGLDVEAVWALKTLQPILPQLAQSIAQVEDLRRQKDWIMDKFKEIDRKLTELDQRENDLDNRQNWITDKIGEIDRKLIELDERENKLLSAQTEHNQQIAAPDHGET